MSIEIFATKELENAGGSSVYEKFSPNMDIVDHSYRAIKESRFIISSSGTATVELAILGVPYLIIYKLNSLSWHILKKMVKIKFVGMVNILAGRKIVEELLQRRANPKKIASLTLEYLKNNKRYSGLEKELKAIVSMLSPANATEKFTDFIGDYLKLT